MSLMYRPLCVLALVLGVGGCTQEDVVAKVGGTSITRSDLELYARSRSGGASPDAALDALVERALLAEAARREELHEDKQIQARIEAAKRELLANAYVDKVASSAASEDALRQKYETDKEKLARRRVHVAHIVVRLAPGADSRARTEAQAKINALYAKVRSGADFAAVAKESSEDPATGQRGGDLGPIQEGQVDPRFFDAVSSLKKDELTEPFETAFGLHIARALAEPETIVPPLNEVKGRLSAELRREAEREVMERLRSEIRVKRYLPREVAVVEKSGGGNTK